MLGKDSREIVTQIEDLSEFLSLDEYVIEKDLYVTQAISIVNKVPHEHYDLIFQGGTSLAKAHRIIERMSEDCDFRIRFKDSEEKLGKAFKRKALRQFRHDLVNALKANGFSVDDGAVRVRNEGQFMSIRANYPSMYPNTKSIKPFIALEFFLGDVRVNPEIKPVTTLIKQVFGDKINHPEFNINSVAIVETAAEKWVALTRRIATSAHREHYRDISLVRHLYDLHKIDEHGHFTDKFNKLVVQVVHSDRNQYKNHNDDYYRDPVGEIQRALGELHKSSEWRDNWQTFVNAMVFEKNKPAYDRVLNSLSEKTDGALILLKDEKFLSERVNLKSVKRKVKPNHSNSLD